jgi:hypothetical protein
MAPREHTFDANPLTATRRTFLQGGVGLGSIALTALARSGQEPAPGPLAPKAPPHPARAKRVIYLAMSGAPPQLDLFDPKPELSRLHGTPAPSAFFEGKRLAFIKGHPKLLGAPHGFAKYGASGMDGSVLTPGFERYADKVCLVRSMCTDQFNHAPADLLLWTGNPTVGKASMGAWVTWGLGTPNQDLPGFVVLISGGSDPTGGSALWGSGFLPSEHQGVRLRSAGEPVLYVNDPQGLSRPLRRRMLDALRRANEADHAQHGDPETLARIAQYELAFRMQTSVPEVMDISAEPAQVLEDYGATPGKASFANNCLLARRLAEAGVRFIQLHDWGWDLHGTNPGDDLATAFPQKCKEIDRPIAALMSDLDERGLLEDTLVVWGGEFGRTPMLEARNGSTLLGRDHHPDCFTIWLAGAGVKRGHVHGATDELGYSIVAGKATVRDLQATILHLLGFDAEALRFPYQGLEQRLIGVEEGPRVMREWLA